jgi:hypothetical protein
LLALLAGILGALVVRTFEWLLDRAEIVTPLFPFWHTSRLALRPVFLSLLLLPILSFTVLEFPASF